jgi:hypothetical protein
LHTYSFHEGWGIHRSATCCSQLIAQRTKNSDEMSVFALSGHARRQIESAFTMLQAHIHNALAAQMNTYANLSDLPQGSG